MVKETSSLVRKLAHNDPTIRRSAFEALTQYLQSPTGTKLKFIELEKLWKGLYYSMWFCDKPIPQQGLAGDLGGLFSQVVSQKKLADFSRAFWAVIAREWHTIDKWRIDKYLMLVRRVLRHGFFRLAADGWRKKDIQTFLDVLEEYPLSNNPKFPQSLAYHVCDIYLDEIEYVIFKEFREYSEEDDVEEESESDNDSDSDSDDEDNSSELETDEVPSKKDTKEVPSKPSMDEQEIDAKKKQILAKTPIKTLIAPFETLAATAKNSAMRKRCQEEVLGDPRLKEWGINLETEAQSDDEWTGF